MSNLPELARPAAGMPKAATEQVDIQPWEGGLLDLARVHHPTVLWWHGYRQAEQGFGSYCYVCESFIANWGGNAGPSKKAVVAIDEHKYRHYNGENITAKTPSRKRRTA